MKRIPLTQGKYALVDDEDYERVNRFKWSAHKEKEGRYYAVRITKRPESRLIRMHREIMNEPEGRKIDHINGDGLDNRKRNLRECTQAENLRNRGKQANNTSGYKGAYWSREKKKWEARIKVNGKSIFLGYFGTPEAAARAYDAAAREHHGDFAKLNF